MSVAGEGLIARLRSAWFGLLGMGTAAALALVALVLNQGFPGIAELPFPSAPAELGVSQNERVVPGAPRSASQQGETRASSSSPGGEAGRTPSRTAVEAKVEESRKIATVPAPPPKPAQIEQPPPPSTGGEGAAPQPQPPPASPISPSPASSPTTTSVGAPKGEDEGWSGAPGHQAKGKDRSPKGKEQPSKSKPAPPQAKAPPPIVLPVAPPPKPWDKPWDFAEAEKRHGKSGRGR